MINYFNKTYIIKNSFGSYLFQSNVISNNIDVTKEQRMLQSYKREKIPTPTYLKIEIFYLLQDLCNQLWIILILNPTILTFLTQNCQIDK